jgi:hypothetical protein
MRDIVIIYGGYKPNYTWGAQSSSHVTTGKKRAHHFSGSEEKTWSVLGTRESYFETNQKYEHISHKLAII